MTVITIPQPAPPVLTPRQMVRNGLYPVASFTHQLIDLANHASRWRPKEVARFASAIANSGPIAADGGGAGTSRERYRVFFHSSPYASRLWAIVSVALPNATAANPYVRIRCETTAPATVGDVTYYGGKTTLASGDNPSFFSSSGRLAFLSAGVPATLPANTDLQLTFSDFDDARLINAVVYEEALGSDTANGYVDPNIALLSPIYDATREGLAGLLRNMWAFGGAQLFNWSTLEVNPTAVRPRKISAPTAATNLIDRTSTGAPTAASAGFTLDLSNCTQLRDSSSGVRATMRVYGNNSTNGNGSVVLKNAAGTTVISVGPFTTTNAWQSASGYLTNGVDKYDLQFSTANGQLTVGAVSCYLDPL